MLRDAKAWCAEHGRPFCLHLAESPDETELLASGIDSQRVEHENVVADTHRTVTEFFLHLAQLPGTFNLQAVMATVVHRNHTPFHKPARNRVERVLERIVQIGIGLIELISSFRRILHLHCQQAAVRIVSRIVDTDVGNIDSLFYLKFAKFHRGRVLLDYFKILFCMNGSFISHWKNSGCSV